MPRLPAAWHRSLSRARRAPAGAPRAWALSAERAFAFAILWCALGTACRRAPPSGSSLGVGSAEPAPSAGAPSPRATAAGASSLPPLDVSWLEPLPLADGNLAYVMPPVGAREPRPLIVGVHGAGDRPDWACGGWRLAASEYAFVVCPQGLEMDALRYGWDSPRTIEQRVASALSAVRARFGPYIADGPTLYVGFSQGATLSGPVLLAQPQRFPVVALAEGGYELLRDPAFLARLHANGTARVMIVCGSAACFQTAKSVAPGLTRAGLEVLTAGDPNAGHNLNQQMQDALHAAWPGFVSGLANWSDFPAYAQRHAR